MIGGSDTEFYIRAKRSGARIVKAENAIVHRHYNGPRITFRGLLVYALHRGNYSAHILRVHGTPQQIRGRLLKAIKKLSLGVIQLPACALSKTALAAKLFQIGIEVGFIYGVPGRKYSGVFAPWKTPPVNFARKHTSARFQKDDFQLN